MTKIATYTKNEIAMEETINAVAIEVWITL